MDCRNIHETTKIECYEHAFITLQTKWPTPARNENSNNHDAQCMKSWTTDKEPTRVISDWLQVC